MTGLALRSLRHRPAAATATFVAVLLGTALIGTFATFVESALHLHGEDRTSLIVMGAVVGGWGALIVLYSVASTAGITATQRTAETSLLRVVGATPRQVRRLIGREVLVVSLLAAAGGSAVAAVAGRVLFGALRDGGMVSDGARFGGGPASVAAAAGLVVLTSCLAAWIAGLRATRPSAVAALRAAEIEPRGMHWWRAVVGGLLIAYGVGAAVVTLTVTRHSADPYDAMSTCGAASIYAGVGMAVLAPWLLRRFSAPVAALVGRTASGHLAAHNAARRSHLLAGVLAPVIVLTSGAIGTLMLVGIDNRTMHDPAQRADGRLINMLNYVVTGMISLFAAIVVVNAFAAVVAHRRTELRRLRLVGATRAQVRSSVVAEAGIVAAVGIVLGTLGSLTTVVPFAVVRHEGLVPDGQLWLPPAVAAAVVLLTLVSARASVQRATRELAG
ncbi:ABC transporter permease [Nocardioides panacisoli]|uniref:ABC3 transporter permease C-terminal domain-containing protein n=1 Tax=Nocardioides panacisoli TaxID=627624 RepID=A0ABP7IT87_9ACTN